MMCGNASRCIGKYLYEHDLTDRTEVSLETLSGIKVLHLHIENGKVERVTVDMGEPSGIRPVALGDGLSLCRGYRRKHGQSPSGHLHRRHHGCRPSDGRPDSGKSPAVSRPRERGIRTDSGQRKSAHACVGKRFGHHTGLRNGCMRHSRSRPPSPDGATDSRTSSWMAGHSPSNGGKTTTECI